MTSRFLNVFSDLDIDEDLRELISETEVVRISTNTVKSSLHIFIDGGSEIPKDKLFKLQSELKQSLFGGKNICVSILREDRRLGLNSDIPFEGGRAVGAYKENAEALSQGPSNETSFNASQGAASTAQLHQCVAYGSIAVRMKLHRMPHDIRHFIITSVIQPFHRMENTPLHWFQSVVDMRYSTFQYHIRGIIEKPILIHAT